MNELTLESLARRVEALEQALALSPNGEPARDWRRVVGMFKDSEFMRRVDEEGRAIREAEREGGAVPRIMPDDPAGHRSRHAAEIPEKSARGPLAQKLNSLPPGEIVAVSIITVEEQMRGWLAAIAKEKQARRQIVGYRELTGLLEYFREFTVAPFDQAAADRFDELKAARLRIGTMDLKIAAIAVVRQALLLSANLRDFERVAGLRVENWAD